MSRKTVHRTKRLRQNAASTIARSAATPRPFHIFGVLDGVTTHLRIGSTRLGRALRAAKEIARYTKADVFVSQAAMVMDTWTPTGKHYPADKPHPITSKLLAQAKKRRGIQALIGWIKNGEKGPVPDEAVDWYREDILEHFRKQHKPEDV